MQDMKALMGSFRVVLILGEAVFLMGVMPRERRHEGDEFSCEISTEILGT